MKKAINIMCSIGNISLTAKAIKSLEVERKFSDMANKFSMVIIDTPQTGLTDLELFMCAGNRTISISYNDNPDSSGFITFKGQIWDYESSFVGNIKQLTISGYLSKTVSYDTSSSALYNIDWNNYYCMRANTEAFWNVNEMQFKDFKIKSEWLDRNTESYDDDKSKYIIQNQNVVVYPNFASLYSLNAISVKITGPGGSIKLPIPDSFAPMILFSGKEGTYAGDDKDPKSMLWGELGAVYVNPKTGKPYLGSDQKPAEPSDPENYDIFWVQQNDHYPNGEPILGGGAGSYRAFKRVNDSTAYIQLNPNKQYFGAGTFLNSSLGVDPSYIVKQLCELEGWTYTESSIVQTAMVPNSDKFKMSNQSALAFITEVLAPVSVTPVGIYKDKSGNDVQVTQGYAGFTCWFDSDNIFHYEPLVDIYKRDKRDILLGYNIPNSPVISFQVATKGTCFYTTNVQKINTLYITTGEQKDAIDTTSSSYMDEYNKVKGHNENLDNFFGYTYEEVNDMYNKTDQSNTNGLYLGFGNNTKIDSNLDYSKYNETLSTIDADRNDAYVTIVSSDIQKRLVNSLISSGEYSSLDLSAQLKNAALQIENFTITATLTMWADTRISPASLINITNMVKSTDNEYVSRHPTSGEYLVIKQVDKISGSDFTQTLSLLRNKTSWSDNINPQHIDFSKGVRLDDTKTDWEKEQEQLLEFRQKRKELALSSPLIQSILTLWDNYLNAIVKKHPDWVWWGDPSRNCLPAIYFEILLCWKGENLNLPASESWYRFKKDSKGNEIHSLDNLEIDPNILDWYNKAQKANAAGKLGDEFLHIPSNPSHKPSFDKPDYYPDDFNHYGSYQSNSSNGIFRQSELKTYSSISEEMYKKK